MLSFLKNHPFAVEAHFKSSLVLTFAVPKEQLQTFIPKCLELDTFDQKWAFVAMAIVKTTELRPKGFPKFIGNSFSLIGYRIFVKYINNDGKRLRGLYILKSETNKKKMEFLGNIFTHYNYSTTDITQVDNDHILEISSLKSNFNIKVDFKEEDISLPDNSPFTSWKEARRYAGPLPFTFTYNPETKKVLIIEGVRESWIPKPIKIIDYNISFLAKLKLNQPILANAFIINDIPYYWKKGKTETWKK